MSGVEVAGLALAAVPVLFERYSHALDVLSTIADEYAKYHARVNEYGISVTIFLEICFPDALLVMDRVERYVLRVDDQHVSAFMNSYTSSFNMIGVAGAIIAQVAISAISLTGLENSHWTAEAFFVISLVTGCLSVFFSCAISPAFHGLHSAEDIKDFLTKPTPSVNTRKFNLAVSQLRKHKDQLNEFSEDEINILRELVERGRWKVASAYAAIMLVVPMTLLKVALNAFLIGLGIYLGKMYTANLIPSYGFGSIGVLVFYLVSALFGIGMYYVTQSLKYLESSPLERWRMILDDHKKNGRRNQQMGDAPNEIGNDVRLPSPGHFRQSRHVREGNTIHFVTDETVGSTVDRNEPRLVERPRNSTEDESLRLTKEQASPNPRLTSDIANSNEAAASPGLDLGNMKDILKELIRVQEESFRVNQRLLDVLNME